MAVASKLLDEMERCGFSRERLSWTLVGCAMTIYTIWVAGRPLKRITMIPRSTSDNNNETDKTVNVTETENHLIERPQPGLNREFVMALIRLIRIMVPRTLCRETALLGAHTACLISRTFLSITVAAMEGRMVKYIVQRDVRAFSKMLLQWLGIAVPATFVNSMIRYLENRLALAFRTRLVNHVYRLYFNNQVFYRCSNLDSRIENADQLLTDDIATFASSVAHLYSHLTKPCFDLLLIGLAMARSSQRMRASMFSGPILAFVVISTTAHVLRLVSPKFGYLVAEEASRYGYLRHIHSRIITHAEEIAFYGGHRVELQQLREAYDNLTRHMNRIFEQRLWFVMLEQFFMKYVWSGTGMVMVSLPILTTNRSRIGTSDSISDRTQYLTTARNLLISGADAIERLMSSYKEIVSLAGYTHRVADMLVVFDDTSRGVYTRRRVNGNQRDINTAVVAGRVTTGGVSICLTRVPIVTPNCDIVVDSLSVTIHPGMHVLITGPNGCGKSSLFRILSGLWPVYGGELCIPAATPPQPCMFYIPQRPYMSIGTLRDQLIYPDTREDMESKKIDEFYLRNILRMVALEHIAQRDNLDEVRDWKDILSGGEKQRMAMARLFYHRPRYALLDECTSAVSIDVESSIYEAAKNMGITLLTITHRPTLRRFHTHLLEFDGLGSWAFTTL
ncbi:ATP-binding cassette sub-family D member 1 [Phlebotomus argentipes]|uniref:ATP-binding cassette sub-family D member 1 n=1 Tax=Phlebotomus argentipes TaxID=94469 RepID=UPI002892E4DE|nr:ATP-binding cassette sub-family D member 1 [Phlebotomus argentipes]XP_059609648.1 ATP-binding cassette sub-family D member 1 [Phlebotomus argentipes]XP_059609649.1 ATP-binding cassette sub-family D member 1 [Phlebotomus argentipes]